MARKNTSNTQVASAFLNVVLTDEVSGESFTLAGKALPATDLPKGKSKVCRVVRKLWEVGEALPTGNFPFEKNGSFEAFCRANGIRIELTIRRTDEVNIDDEEADDISF